MTTRYSGLTIILDRDIREDDAQGVIEAIKHIKGVLEVNPHPGNMDEQIAASRLKSKLTDGFIKLIEDL